jgi:hypothetical protein
MRILVTALASILIGGCFGQPGSSRDITRTTAADALICSQGEPATLVKVIDGDTIDVKLSNGKEERIRLIGIDTPERGETCFSEATDRLKELLTDGRVALIKDKSERDRYGRSCAMSAAQTAYLSKANWYVKDLRCLTATILIPTTRTIFRNWAPKPPPTPAAVCSNHQ